MQGNGQGPKPSSNGTAARVATPRLASERTPGVTALDALIRRRLMVSDPSSPDEIAGALSRAYPNEKAKLDREAGGLPFATGPLVAAPSVSPEFHIDATEVVANVDRDLDTLTSSNLLGDVRPELRGWTTAIRSAIASGLAAARAATDPRQRERVFASRRVLGEYSRMARYVGILTPSSAPFYRQLARNVDEAAAVLLVTLGEGLATQGAVGARFLPQVPASDLQSRREAVLLALRGLVGSAPSGSPDGWPRGVLAHLQVSDLLQTAGYADLLPLLQEGYLTRQLDELLDAATGFDPEGIRALSSSAEPILNGLRRLVVVCQGAAFPPSPSLEAFRAALQHFTDPFEPNQSATGYRLPFIARPALLIGRLGGMAGPDFATRRLINLTNLRHELADEIDSFLEFDYGNDVRAQQQLFLDTCLHVFDKSIDLYTLGTDPNGDEAAEWRAAAFGYIAHVVRVGLPFDARAQLAAAVLRQMHQLLVYWIPQPGPPAPPPALLGPAPNADVAFGIGEELGLLRASEERWFDLVRNLAPNYVAWARGAGAVAPTLLIIENARLMAVAPVVDSDYLPEVPRDVPTILEDVF
jgi:hypothetical protein